MFFLSYVIDLDAVQTKLGKCSRSGGAGPSVKYRNPKMLTEGARRAGHSFSTPPSPMCSSVWLQSPPQEPKRDKKYSNISVQLNIIQS